MNKRTVIKIGSDILTADNGLNYERIVSISRDVSILHVLGYQALMVSSGAISSGTKKFNSLKPESLPAKRAMAAIGQPYLIEAWIKALHPILVAQALLTWKELDDKESSKKIKETFIELLSNGVIPVINENDVVADEEIRFTDNDQLAVKVAKLIGADRLIILTDVDGLYDSDPKSNKKAQLTKNVKKLIVK